MHITHCLVKCMEMYISMELFEIASCVKFSVCHPFICVAWSITDFLLNDMGLTQARPHSA